MDSTTVLPRPEIRSSADDLADGEITAGWTMRFGPQAGVWFAAALVAVGFGLIGFAWAKVAPLTLVAQQIPYLISAGLTGVGLVVVGSALLVVWSRRSDDAERRRQTTELVSTLRDIRAALDVDATLGADTDRGGER